MGRKTVLAAVLLAGFAAHSQLQAEASPMSEFMRRLDPPQYGITLGTEFIAWDIDAGNYFSIRPSIGYKFSGHSTMGMDLAIPLGNTEGGWFFEMYLRLPRYFSFTPSSPWSGFLDLEFLIRDFRVQCPHMYWWARPDVDSAWLMHIAPWVRYTHSLDSLSFFGEVDVPLSMLAMDHTRVYDESHNFYEHRERRYGAFRLIALNFTLGMKNLWGNIDLAVAVNNVLRSPWMDAEFFNMVSVIASQEYGRFGNRIEARMPTGGNRMDYAGWNYRHEFWFWFTRIFQVNAHFCIRGIGADAGRTVNLGMGARLNFRERRIMENAEEARRRQAQAQRR